MKGGKKGLLETANLCNPLPSASFCKTLASSLENFKMENSSVSESSDAVNSPAKTASITAQNGKYHRTPARVSRAVLQRQEEQTAAARSGKKGKGKKKCQLPHGLSSIPAARETPGPFA